MTRAWWQPTWLIVRREVDERFRARSFRIVTVIVMLAVAAAVVIPALVHSHHRVDKVGVVGQSDPAITRAALEAGRVTGNRVTVVPVTGVAAARAMLRSGGLDVAVVDGREVLIKQRQLAGANSSSSSLAGVLAQLVGLERRLRAPVAAAALTGGLSLPIRGVDPPPRSLASRFTALGVNLLIYIIIFFYGIRIAQSVGEEKTSRVVEVLLATVRSTQLLTGKMVGFAIVAFAQMLAVGATFAVLALAVGSHAIRGAAGGVALIGALWLVLGFALYCTAFAAAGSLISRQSEVGNASMPLLIPLILAYSLSNGVLFGSGSSSFYHVLAFVPWTAPVAMPTMFATGAAPLWQVGVSALLCLLATVATARIAGVVYDRSVMRTGARVRLRSVLRSGAA
ncbi:MAG: ABC transporter permease [Actinomycetota bacterium]|nr:ABC transporter permease [Actinomycetota bacterium]